MEGHIILRTLVGSRAHGLANPSSSDYDYRGVYITPTSELLKVDAGAYKGSHWLEGKDDDTSYEIAHFLHLAMKSNPSILEVMVAPVVESTPIGSELRKLFPYVWSSRGVYDAFNGYSTNQRIKMLSDNEQYVKRKWKYACAHIRVLLMGIQLLDTGKMSLDTQTYGDVDKYIPTSYSGSWIDYLRGIKMSSDFFASVGEIIDVTEELKRRLKVFFDNNPSKESNVDIINNFLLQVRKDNW